jgi:hypothetical protein
MQAVAKVGIQVRTVENKIARCKSCQARIVWAVTVAGKRIPLDEGAEVAGTIGDVVTVRAVPHFATCPQAAQHRKRRGTV